MVYGRRTRKKVKGKKRTSQKRNHVSLENLEKKIEERILQKLQESGKLNGNFTKEENKNKPKSGHAIAGETWDQSEAGKKWKREIDAAQHELDTMLQQENYNMSASGKYARELASKKRKNPDQSHEIAQQIVKKIIENKSKQSKQQFQQERPKSPQKIIQTNVKDSDQIQSNNETSSPFLQSTNQQNNLTQPLIGGFFDNDSDEDV